MFTQSIAMQLSFRDMKKLILFLLIVPMVSFGQNFIKDEDYLKRVDPEKIIGMKIKFLKDNDNKRGYMGFGYKNKTFPYLSYKEHVGRVAEIIGIKGKLLKLKMLDNGKIISADWYDSVAAYFKNNIGFIDLLEKANNNYLEKKFTFKGELVTIKKIEFSETDEKYSQLYGPVKFYYEKRNGEIDDFEGHITSTYTYTPPTYDHQKERIFENVFKNIDYEVEINNQNIRNFFKIVEDDFEDSKIYHHNNFIIEDYYNEYGEIFINTRKSGLMTRVVQDSNGVRILFNSVHSSSDWLFHDYFKINIGGKIKLESSTDKSPIREVVSYGIYELNSYDSKDDFNIIKSIAENSDKKIKIRIYGSEFYKDYELDGFQKNGIKQSFQLYSLLKQN